MEKCTPILACVKPLFQLLYHLKQISYPFMLVNFAKILNQVFEPNVLVAVGKNLILMLIGTSADIDATMVLIR